MESVTSSTSPLSSFDTTSEISTQTSPTEAATTTTSPTSVALSTSSTHASGGINIPAVTGGAVAAGIGLLIIIVIVIVLVIKRKRRKKKPTPELPDPRTFNPPILSMDPPAQNDISNSRTRLTSQIISESIQEDLPSVAYEDPEKAAPRPIIKDISTKSALYVNLHDRHTSVEDNSDGVYIEPPDQRPNSNVASTFTDRPATDDSTYIAMGMCAPPPSPFAEPTHPEDLDVEGERDAVYTMPNPHGSPPPPPCGSSGYVNLQPESASGQPSPPAEDYQNFGSHISAYRNIIPDISRQQPSPSAGRSPESQSPTKKALKPPKTGPCTPPKPSPKPTNRPAVNRSPLSARTVNGNGASPRLNEGAVAAAAKAAPSTPTPSAKPDKKPALRPSPSPHSGQDQNGDSSDSEDYENLLGGPKQDYMNVPKKKTDPKHPNGQLSGSPSAAGSATGAYPSGVKSKIQKETRQGQGQGHFPPINAIMDEFKQKRLRPK